MRLYDKLLIEAESEGITVHEKHLKSSACGLIYGNSIAINSDLNQAHKTCVLAEELGHYYTTTGDILDQRNLNNIRQEFYARMWAYEKLVPLPTLIKLFDLGHINRRKMSEVLEVTDDFLLDAINLYRHRYGLYVDINHHKITFEPLDISKEYL